MGVLGSRALERSNPDGWDRAVRRLPGACGRYPSHCTMWRYDGQIMWIGCGHCNNELKRWKPTEDDVRRFEQGCQIHDDHCTRTHDARAMVNERIQVLADKRWASGQARVVGLRMSNPQLYAGKP